MSDPSELTYGCLSLDVGESAAAPPPAPSPAAAMSGAWTGPAEGPTTGVQVGQAHAVLSLPLTAGQRVGCQTQLEC